ncbi:hypothetical protein CANINC_002322 [Pichia inconspicua]|uniref:ATP-dependent RNA helicase n=1 Tax=Pichia inconspicua TaxID=52247 RepID=A0A4T0X2U6_9ASCO|nr:hypothetical protein CANINC_002322 [[Candida] inconspicua]
MILLDWRLVTKHALRSIVRKQRYSSKVPSDETLLKDIMNESSSNDVTTLDEQGNAAYRKKSTLEQFQTKKSLAAQDPNYVPPLGPKYWKSQFRKSYQKVEKGLSNSLEAYVMKNMDVIESFNKKHRKTVEQRIKVDLNKTLKWKDVISNYSLRSAILKYLQIESSKELTPFQNRYFALMSAYSSTVAKGPCGCGKSFSLLVSALSLRRSSARGKGINSLIIVKSNALVHQYAHVTASILRNMSHGKNFNHKRVAQFLFRGTAEEEIQQEDDLTDVQYPHILITTPQRLLDILSSRGMDFVKINALSFVGVDDFNTMIDETFLFETPKKAPIVKLMDYVLKLQDYRRSHNDPHPQVVLLSDDSATENLLSQIKEYTKWIDWKKFATIGKFGEEDDIPHYKFVGSKSAVSSVLIKPDFTNYKNQGELHVDLFDMHMSDYGETSKSWLDTLYRSTLGNSMSYKKHRNIKWSSLPLAVKLGQLEILCLGLSVLLNGKSIQKWYPRGKKGLIVHADEFSSKQVVDMLSKKTERKVRQFSTRFDLDIFDSSTTNDELLAINVSSLPGLTLKNLDTIFILGIEAIKNEHTLAMIMGRTRPGNGLIPESEYGFFAQRDNKTDYIPRSRTFILSSMTPDGYYDPLDRNFLMRSFVKNGLVKQLPIVGVDEPWTKDMVLDYERAMNGPEANDNFETIQFGGIDYNSDDEK